MSDDTDELQLNLSDLLRKLADDVHHLVWDPPHARRRQVRIVRPSTKHADLVPHARAELLAGAHRCAALGWHVFPLVAALVDDEAIAEDYKLAKRTGKHPAVSGWPDVATTDPATIDALWEPRAAANVGIATGAKSNLTVVDVDVKTAADGKDIDGRIAILRLEQTHGDLPPGPRVRRGLGRHLYFQYVSALGNSAGTIPGIDVRGEHGFVVAPPSFHRSGGRYQFAPGSLETPVPKMPTWLIDELLAASTKSRRSTRRARPTPPPAGPSDTPPAGAEAYAAAALAAEVAAVAEAAEGTRNDTLNRAAFSLGQLVGAGVLDRDDVRDALTEAATSCGLCDDEIEQTLERALDDGERYPRGLSHIKGAAASLEAVGTEEVR